MKLMPLSSEWSNDFGAFGNRQTSVVLTAQVLDVVDGADLRRELLLSEYQFPEKAIVKCSYCGSYCARKTNCLHCGGVVD